jgi:hypothetical protein
MIVLKKAIPRRAFLRGAGATLALPLLDAMTPAFASEATRPIRLLFMEVPNGIMMDRWTPATEGRNFAMTPILKPLEKFRSEMLVVSGLDQNAAKPLPHEAGGDHPRPCTAWLTGTHAKMTSGADVRAGISADQVAAREFRKHTQFGSLEIGLEATDLVGSCEATFACAYNNTISWANETSPLPMENRPNVLFERLFGDLGADPNVRLAIMRENRSILDGVLEDVARLKGDLGPADRAKIEQYLEAVRDVERRIQLAATQKHGPLPKMQTTAGMPEKFSDYYKVMTDIMVLAWQTDMTRVGTFQVGHEMSGRAYPELGFGDPHHSITHHSGDQEKIDKVVQINVFHTTLLAGLLEKLRATKDGDGSLLDHSLILYGGAISDGNIHLFTNLPLTLVAGKKTGLQGGHHIRFPKGTPMTNLLLTMLDTGGVQDVKSLGDSTGRLKLPTVAV